MKNLIYLISVSILLSCASNPKKSKNNSFDQSIYELINSENRCDVFAEIQNQENAVDADSGEDLLVSKQHFDGVETTVILKKDTCTIKRIWIQDEKFKSKEGLRINDSLLIANYQLHSEPHLYNYVVLNDKILAIIDDDNRVKKFLIKNQ